MRGDRPLLICCSYIANATALLYSLLKGLALPSIEHEIVNRESDVMTSRGGHVILTTPTRFEPRLLYFAKLAERWFSRFCATLFPDHRAASSTRQYTGMTGVWRYCSSCSPPPSHPRDPLPVSPVFILLFPHSHTHSYKHACLLSLSSSLPPSLPLSPSCRVLLFLPRELPAKNNSFKWPVEFRVSMALGWLQRTKFNG